MTYDILYILGRLDKWNSAYAWRRQLFHFMRPVQLLIEQIHEFQPAYAVIQDEHQLADVQSACSRATKRDDCGAFCATREMALMNHSSWTV